MHRAWVILALLGAGCGRLGYEEVAADAQTVPDAAGSLPSPIFFVDAANVDGNGTAGSSGCPTTAPSMWTDLVSGTQGLMTNFAPCGTGGWVGDGTPSSPYRLSFAEQGDPGLSFGFIAATQQYTVEAWVQYTGMGNFTGTGTGGIRLAPIVSKGSADTDSDITKDVNYVLGVSETGELAADYEDEQTSDNHPVSQSGQFPTGTWHQVVYSFDDVEQRLYIDADMVASQAQTIPASVATNSVLSIGSSFESTGIRDSAAWDGDIAIVRIFSRALDISEVRAECDAFASRFSVNCEP
jgi:hypothetical protein